LKQVDLPVSWGPTCWQDNDVEGHLGLLRTEEGEVTDGGVYYEGKPIHKFYPEDIARMGILQVMEGRRLAEHLTVEENLRAGGLIIPGNGRGSNGIWKWCTAIFQGSKELKTIRLAIAQEGSSR